MEATVVTAGALIVLGSYKLFRRLRYLIRKKGLKKGLVKAFESIDSDTILRSLTHIEDFDKKHNSNKLPKYLLDIVNAFDADDTKPTLNRNNTLGLMTDFSMIDTIFDETEEEVKEATNILDEKLIEIEQKRREVILRKNEIRSAQILKNSKMRRTSNSMG